MMVYALFLCVRLLSCSTCVVSVDKWGVEIKILTKLGGSTQWDAVVGWKGTTEHLQADSFVLDLDRGTLGRRCVKVDAVR